jgi:hypothetical protein
MKPSDSQQDRPDPDPEGDNVYDFVVLAVLLVVGCVIFGMTMFGCNQ